MQTIAHEIREELGADAALTPMAVVQGDASAPAEISARTRVDPSVWHRHFHQIEERIDRLEATVAAAVDLLHALLHPEKVSKPGSPKGR